MIIYLYIPHETDLKNLNTKFNVNIRSGKCIQFDTITKVFKRIPLYSMISELREIPYFNITQLDHFYSLSDLSNHFRRYHYMNNANPRKIYILPEDTIELFKFISLYTQKIKFDFVDFKIITEN